MLQSIYNLEVVIEVSDPWEFGTVHGTGPFPGHLTKLFSSEGYRGGKLAVLKMDTGRIFNGVCYEFLLVQARHTDASVDDIENGKMVFCNLSAISERSANTLDPLMSSRDDPPATVLIGSVVCKKGAR